MQCQTLGNSWTVTHQSGEGSGTPLQYSCLENPMDGGTCQAAVHGVAKSRTQLSDFTFTFQFHALEKEMATHSNTLAWRIPGTQVRSLGREDPLEKENGNPLQYYCLENPMEGGAWQATVHGVTKSGTRLSDFTFTFMPFSHSLQLRLPVA